MKRNYWLLAVVTVLYLAIVLAHIETRRPWNDEAFFAIPAENLMANGFMGLTNFEETGSGFTNVNRYAYFFFPLNVVVVAGWFKLVGASLFNIRILSTIFMLGLLAVYFSLMKRLTNEVTAWIAAGLVAFDYQMLLAASFGRYEPLVSLLGFGGYYAFLSLRQKDLRLAVGLSNALICLCGMSHPNGLMFFCGLLFLTLYHDWRNLKWNLLPWFCLPYLAGAAAWGNFIMKSPQDFYDQMHVNSYSRLGLLDPLGAIAGEVKR